MTTYTPNVPQETQTIAFTQPLIENNFIYINTAMKIDHAWNGNEIASQADGSHQKISFPNQPANITGALPTGISAIMYAIGGNIFSWNGAKRPVSGITVTGSNTFNTSPVSIATLPNDCIGYVMFVESTVAGQQIGPSFSFMTNAGVGTVTNRPATSTFSIRCAATNLQATHDTAITTTYKIIYWPI
jgi:hypothetical protein